MPDFARPVPLPAARRLQPKALAHTSSSHKASVAEAFARAVLEELELSDGRLHEAGLARVLTAPSLLEQVASAPRLAIHTSTAARVKPAARRSAVPLASSLARAPTPAALASIAASLPAELVQSGTAPARERLTRVMSTSAASKMKLDERKSRLEAFNSLGALPFAPLDVHANPRYDTGREEILAVARERAAH